MDEQRKIVTLLVALGIPVFLLLVAMLYQMYSVGVSPLKGEGSVNTKIEQQEAQLKRLKKLIANDLPKAKKELEELSNNQELAAQLLPVDVKAEEILKFIYAKAEEARIDLLGVSPVAKKSASRKKKKGGNQWEEHVYTMKVAGSYDEIGLFINYLEMFEHTDNDGKVHQRLFNIRNFSLEAGEDGLSEVANHKATMELVAYEFKASKKKGRRR